MPVLLEEPVTKAEHSLSVATHKLVRLSVTWSLTRKGGGLFRLLVLSCKCVQLVSYRNRERLSLDLSLFRIKHSHTVLSIKESFSTLYFTVMAYLLCISDIKPRLGLEPAYQPEVSPALWAVTFACRQVCRVSQDLTFYSQHLIEMLELC